MKTLVWSFLRYVMRSWSRAAGGGQRRGRQSVAHGGVAAAADVRAVDGGEVAVGLGRRLADQHQSNGWPAAGLCSRVLSVAYISVGVGFEFRYEYLCPSGSTRAIHSGRRSRGMPIYGFYASSQSQTELAKSDQNPPNRPAH